MTSRTITLDVIQAHMVRALLQDAHAASLKELREARTRDERDAAEVMEENLREALAAFASAGVED